MLSIGPMSGGQCHYYTELAREDYYLAGGEPPGLWHGKGAERLNLSGHVNKEQLGLLFDGFSPTGQSLVQNAGTDKRRPGFDLTFSAPKSVSVMWAMSRPDVRREVQHAQAEAVRVALDFLEEEAGYIRTGKAGVNFHKAGIVAALFEHGTSRALDPQLHTHALLLNMGLDEDGRARALVHTKFFNLKMLAGAIYRAELAAQLEHRLGVVVERDVKNGFGFVVSGIKESLIDFFSKRRAEIEDLLGTAGLETACAAEYATKQTRTKKASVPSRDALFEWWHEDGDRHEFAAEQVHGLLGKAPSRDFQQERATAQERAMEKLKQSHSHFSREQLGEHLAEAAIGCGLGAKAVRELLEDALVSNERTVGLGVDENGVERFTLKETQNAERALLNSVEKLSERRMHGAAPKIRREVLEHYSSPRSAIREELKHHATGLLKALKRESHAPVNRDELHKASNFRLSREQADVVRHLTVRGRGSIRCLEGDAGTGKTTTLGIAREIWEKAGYNVVGICLSGKAAEELRSGAKMQAMTYAKFTWLLDNNPGIGDQAKHLANQLWRAFKGRKTFDLKSFDIAKKSVLVVDEAGMLDTAQMSRLVDEVRKAGAMLVLAGDRKQLQAIGPGGAFAYIADKVGMAELKSIIRQRDTRDRQIVIDVGEGASPKALQDLKDRGLLKFGDNRREALRMLVDDWLATEKNTRPGSSLIFANTHAEVEEINRKCQEGLRGAKTLGTESLVINGDTLHKNDRVLLTTTARRHGVNNGDVGTVIGIDKSLKRPGLTVRLDRGATVYLPLDDYEGIKLGYAVTTHKGQGTTVDRAYLLAGGRMQSKEISYVQVSRTREPLRLYATRFEADEKLERLARAMSRSAEKTLAQAITDREEQTLRQRLRQERR